MRAPIVALTLLPALAGASLAPAWPAAADTIEEKAAVCVTCHGEQGVPPDPSFPIIWGQQMGYLYLQLKDFKSLARKNEAMLPFIADLPREDLLALAEYFSKKPWPRVEYKASAADIALAQPAIVAGQCPTCHLDGFVGSSAIPRLAGQQFEYLRKTTMDFKTRERANNPFMNGLLASYPDAVVRALSAYAAAR